MHIFFKKKKEVDINKLLSFTKFSKIKKYKKFMIKNISNLKDAQSGDISFYDSLKYVEDRHDY